jgi:hypothetical protein
MSEIKSFFNEFNMFFSNKITDITKIIWLIKNSPDAVYDYICFINKEIYDWNANRRVIDFNHWRVLNELYQNDKKLPCPVSEVCRCETERHKPRRGPFILRPKKFINWYSILENIDSESNNLLFDFYLIMLRSHYRYDPTIIKNEHIASNFNKKKFRLAMIDTPVTFELNQIFSYKFICEQYEIHEQEYMKYEIAKMRMKDPVILTVEEKEDATMVMDTDEIIQEESPIHTTSTAKRRRGDEDSDSEIEICYKSRRV